MVIRNYSFPFDTLFKYLLVAFMAIFIVSCDHPEGEFVRDQPQYFGDVEDIVINENFDKFSDSSLDDLVAKLNEIKQYMLSNQENLTMRFYSPFQARELLVYGDTLNNINTVFYMDLVSGFVAGNQVTHKNKFQISWFRSRDYFWRNHDIGLLMNNLKDVVVQHTDQSKGHHFKFLMNYDENIYWTRTTTNLKIEILRELGNRSGVAPESLILNLSTVDYSGELQILASFSSDNITYRWQENGQGAVYDYQDQEIASW